MPEDAPSWLMPYHLDHYGGFHREWDIYHTPEGIPYWYNKTLNKSTWDSPTLILTALITNAIEFDSENQVSSWEGIEGTPFTVVNFKSNKKRKDIQKIWIHRLTK